MIIRSLLDTDLYKFTMMQVVLHHFPAAEVEYRYKCRNDGIDLTPYVDEIRDEIAGLCRLRFQDEELKYLLSLRFIKSDFVDFLSLFHLQQKYITVQPSPLNNGEIDILVKGPWLHTILFEVPVLAIVNEVYFRATQKNPDVEEGRKRLHNKMALIRDDPAMSGCKVADYGTRRRFSRSWHEEVVQT
ncbi:nicotinate phosphoribosyltransferase, partial [Glaciimonas sp. CA11.2]|nr:nicotinate phosphoribosyltransferase [Glaciimonas sp. CA11.2]